MLLYSQLAEENVVLGAESKTLSNTLDVRDNVVVIHKGRPAGRREQPGEHGECGGLTGAIVTQQYRDLTFKNVHGEPVDCYFTLVKHLFKTEHILGV